MREKKKEKKNMQDIEIKDLILGEIKENDVCRQNGKFQSPEIIVKILKEKTALKYSKSFPKIDKFYMYHPGMGIYIEFSNNELIVLVKKIFRYSNLDYPSLPLAESISKHIRLSHDALFGEPIYDKRYIVFSNCLYDLATNQVSTWTPKIFLTTCLPFPYLPDAPCPKFLTYIHEFCNGHEDRVAYIRAWMWAILSSWTEGQVLLYIMGQGSTGKSQLTNIITALIGKNNTLTTTLKDLHTDRFEASNLRGKQLCIISDTEHYKGEMSILKQLVGGDSIRGRLKNLNAALEITPECLVVIVGNFPLGSRDTSGALGRRIRVFHAEHVSDKRVNLLSYQARGTWGGRLAEELTGIIGWVLCQNKDKESIDLAKRYLTHSHEMVPSLRQINEDNLEALNPLTSWIRDEIEPGEGAFVGFTMKRDLKGDLEVQKRRTLYPTYRMWAERREIKSMGHRTFTSDLLTALKSEGYSKVVKVRRTEGIFIEGIRIKDHAYDRDHIFGSTLDLKIPESQIQPPEKMGYQPPEREKQHPVLTLDLYDSYQKILGQTSRKIYLNKRIRSYFSSAKKEIEEKLTLEYFEGKENFSEAYIESFLKVLRRGIQSIASFGAIPFTYKPMGLSPRIYPTAYGNSVNNVKRLIREEAYSFLAQHVDTNIVDFDLKSCFTSILLGLYPKELEALQDAIETIGLWDYIKQEFIQEKKGELYNKNSVKICVYSSFFQGGGNAMITGMMEEHRKNLGLTLTEFRNLRDFERIHASSREIAEIMQNSSVILDLRRISKDMKNAYLGDNLTGPTGHSYKVTEETFPSAYSNYLQSFEFALIADTTLQLVQMNKNIEVLGHFHDGNVLLIPKADLAETKSQYQAKLKMLGYSLGLGYEQRIEVKKEWPGSK